MQYAVRLIFYLLSYNSLFWKICTPIGREGKSGGLGEEVWLKQNGRMKIRNQEERKDGRNDGAYMERHLKF